MGANWNATWEARWKDKQRAQSRLPSTNYFRTIKRIPPTVPPNHYKSIILMRKLYLLTYTMTRATIIRTYFNSNCKRNTIFALCIYAFVIWELCFILSHVRFSAQFQQCNEFASLATSAIPYLRNSRSVMLCKRVRGEEGKGSLHLAEIVSPSAIVWCAFREERGQLLLQECFYPRASNVEISFDPRLALECRANSGRIKTGVVVTQVSALTILQYIIVTFRIYCVSSIQRSDRVIVRASSRPNTLLSK